MFVLGLPSKSRPRVCARRSPAKHEIWVQGSLQTLLLLVLLGCSGNAVGPRSKTGLCPNVSNVSRVENLHFSYVFQGLFNVSVRACDVFRLCTPDLRTSRLFRVFEI